MRDDSRKRGCLTRALASRCVRDFKNIRHRTLPHTGMRSGGKTVNQLNILLARLVAERFICIVTAIEIREIINKNCRISSGMDDSFSYFKPVT
jgi:hypothetical protein